MAENRARHVRAARAFLALAVAVPVLAGPAAGGEGPPEPAVEIARAQKCVRLRTRAGQETLVNACPSCRIVKLERTRPGGAFPAARTYAVPEASRVTLSFRGPGRTRILSEAPCRAAPAGGKAANTSGKSGEAKCTQFRRTKGGPVSLFNRCRACRAVVVERAGRGGERKRQVFAVAGRSSVPLARPGVPVRARIVSEKACR